MTRRCLTILIILILCFTTFSSAGLVFELNDELKVELEQLFLLDRVYVSQVFDGDTFKTGSGESVRLIGVDTPEMNWGEDEAEYYAREAYEYTRDNLLGEYVYLEYDKEKKDKYGRVLAYVFFSDGTLFNTRLLEEGYAQLFPVSTEMKYRDIFKSAAREARERERGIWSIWERAGKELLLNSWQEAAQYVGKEVIVKGKVVSTYNSGKAVFLNFHQDYWNNFSVVIFTDDLQRFDYYPVDYLLDKEIKVMGKIQEYKGLPEIVVDNPVQIWINYSLGFCGI